MGIDVVFAGIPVAELDPALDWYEAPPRRSRRQLGEDGQLRGLKAIPVRSFGKK